MRDLLATVDCGQKCNVGTVLRSCAAAGVTTVLTAPGTAWCWSPKVLRAGMGAHFALRMIEGQVSRLETEIDAMNTKLTPLRSFILPGGSALAAHMHLCRTVCRRAERLVVETATVEDVNPEAVKYLNRLSDWFFVAGRIANNDGKDDVLWVPGLTR